MAKFSSPPAGPLAAGLESDFCRCRLEVLHVFQNFTQQVFDRLQIVLLDAQPQRDFLSIILPLTWQAILKPYKHQINHWGGLAS